MVRGRTLAYKLQETDIRLNESYVSEAIVIGGCRSDVSVQFIATTIDSAANGEIRVQGSNDKTNWENWCIKDSDGYEIDITTYPALESNLFELPSYTPGYMRVKYDYISGDGYADIYMIIKRR